MILQNKELENSQKVQKPMSSKSMVFHIDSSPNFPSSQFIELAPMLPLNKVLPANQILSRNVKADIPAKIKILEKLDFDRQKILKQTYYMAQYGINSQEVDQKLIFEQQQSLGYQFQGKFSDKLIYARFFDQLDKKSWFKMITYDPQMDAYTQDKAKLTKKIKYFSGLFIQNPNYFYQFPMTDQQELKYISRPIKQKNYQPALISFNADYQGANLLFAFRTGLSQFSLVIHNDSNSKGSTQWFNFTISLPAKHPFHQIRFKIVNMTKSTNLFKKGMKIVFKRRKDQTWKRLQTQVDYCKNEVEIQGRQTAINYKTLSFTFDCKHTSGSRNSDEVISFAYGYPYPEEENEKFWNEISQKIPLTKKIKLQIDLKKQTIGKSSWGLPIYSYRISVDEKRKSLSSRVVTNSTLSLSSNKLKSIIIFSRQHPGETQGSFILEGVIEYLFSYQNNFLSSLKKNYVFYVIPFVNPQGVLIGNYRTNGKGYDLNRNWRNPTLECQPQIVSIKRYIAKINKQQQISLILDLHGHSKAMNSFFYGYQRSKTKEDVKLFPFYCSKKLKQVSFKQCYFNVSEDKKNTARAVLTQLYPKALVYTLENSFYGYQMKDSHGKKIIEYNPYELRKFGAELIPAFLQFSQIDHLKNVTKQMLKDEMVRFQNEEQKLISGSEEDSDSQTAQDLISLIGKQLKEQKQQKSNSNFRDPDIIVSQKNVWERSKLRKPLTNRVNLKQLTSQKTFPLKKLQMIDNILQSTHNLSQKRRLRPRDNNRKPNRQQNQNFDKPQKKEEAQISSQEKTPLISINVLRPKTFNLQKIQTDVSFRESRLQKREIQKWTSQEKRRHQKNIMFLNEKQYVYQQIRKKRINDGKNQQCEDQEGIETLSRSKFQDKQFWIKKRQAQRSQSCDKKIRMRM